MFGPLSEAQVERLLSFTLRALTGGVIAATWTGLVFLFRPFLRTWAGGLLTAGLLVELVLFAFNTNPVPSMEQFNSNQSSRTMACLREDGLGQGVQGAPRLIHVASFHDLQGNIIAAQGIPVISATHPLPPKRLVQLLQLVEKEILDPTLPRGIACLRSPESVRSPLLAKARIGRFSCTSLAVAAALAKEGLPRLFPPPGADGEHEGVAIFTSPQPLPRARLCFSWKEVARPEDACASLGREPTSTPIEVDQPLPSPIPPLDECSIKWVKSHPGHMELDVDTAGGRGLLIIADSWYPGWQAEVDGEITPILPADLAFMAIPLQPGTHKVVLTWSDPDCTLTSILFLLGLAGLALLFVGKGK